MSNGLPTWHKVKGVVTRIKDDGDEGHLIPSLAGGCLYCYEGNYYSTARAKIVDVEDIINLHIAYYGAHNLEVLLDADEYTIHDVRAAQNYDAEPVAEPRVEVDPSIYKRLTSYGKF